MSEEGPAPDDNPDQRGCECDDEHHFDDIPDQRVVGENFHKDSMLKVSVLILFIGRATFGL